MIVSTANWLIVLVAACLVLALVGLRLLRQRPLHWFGFSIDGEALVEELTTHLPYATPPTTSGGVEHLEHVELGETVPALMSWWRRQG